MDEIQKPTDTFDCSKVYVKFSDVHGRGVFAKEPVDAGDIIEKFPLTPTVFRTNYQGDPVIIHYCFVNDACDSEECNKHGYMIYLSSGYANIYNSQPAEKCNATFSLNWKELYGTVTAKRPIKIDEEVFVWYGPNYQFPQGEIINHEDSPR